MSSSSSMRSSSITYPPFTWILLRIHLQTISICSQSLVKKQITFPSTYKKRQGNILIMRDIETVVTDWNMKDFLFLSSIQMFGDSFLIFTGFFSYQVKSLNSLMPITTIKALRMIRGNIRGKYKSMLIFVSFYSRSYVTQEQQSKEFELQSLVSNCNGQVLKQLPQIPMQRMTREKSKTQHKRRKTRQFSITKRRKIEQRINSQMKKQI